MSANGDVPTVNPETKMPDVIHEITSKRLGMACVIDGSRKLLGVVTDGDLRRHMSSSPNLLERRAGDVMSRSPVTIRRTALAAEAIRIMEERKITSLVVVNEMSTVEGVVHLHDLWRTEMI